MKKNSLLIVGLVATITLCGCAAKKSDKANDIKFTSYPVETNQTLYYWCSINPNISSIHSNMGETEFAKELEKRTGIHVEYMHPVAGQEEQTLSLLVASDELPDIMEYGWVSYQGGAAKSVKNGIILPLNDYLKDNAPNLTNYLEKNPEIDRMVKTDDGEYYAFPFIREDKRLLKSSGPVVRRDWLNELNLDTPTTISELEDVLRKFKSEKGAVAALSFKNTSINDVLQLFGSTSGFYVDNGKVKYGPLESNYLYACTKLRQWFEEGLLDENFVSVDSKILDSNILNNRTGVTIAGGGGDLGRWLESKKGEDFDLVGFAYPKLDDGNDKAFVSYMSNYPGVGSCAISATTKNPELAMRLLDYGYSDEGYMLYNFGIEGKSYEMKDGKPVYTDEIFKNPDGLSMTQAMGKYFRASWSGPFVQSKDYIDQYYYRPQQSESLENWLKPYDDVKDMQYPQTSMTSDESDEYVSIMLEVEKDVNEARTGFILGTMNDDEFKKACEDLKKLNVEKDVKIKQDAYDRYKKR